MRIVALIVLAASAGAYALWEARPRRESPSGRPPVVAGSPAERPRAAPRAVARAATPATPPAAPPAPIDVAQSTPTHDDSPVVDDTSPLPRIRGMAPAEVHKLRERWKTPDPVRDAIHARRRREAKAWKAYRQRHPDASIRRDQFSGY